MKKINLFKQRPLFVKLLIVIPLITIVSWLISAFYGSSYLKHNLWEQFTSYNSRILESIGNQSIKDIEYGDIFQLRRTLHDFYDENYMKYFAFYTPDDKPLAVFPTQLSGEEMHMMENKLTELAHKEEAYIFFQGMGKERFHFQYKVESDNKVLGYLVMGGTSAHLYPIITSQLLTFIALGILLLFIQIAIIAYFVNKITKPLRNLTKSLHDIDQKGPDEIIPRLIKQRPDPKASSEVHVFYKAYRHLLKEIQKHQENAKQMAVQAAIGNIASHIAHDMRSPLSVINSALDPNLNDGSTDSKPLLEAAKRSTNKLNLMADDLLDYSKARQIEKRGTNITEMINEVVDEVNETAKRECKQIKIIVNTPGVLSAKVDPQRLNRVMANIITNSIQAIKHKDGQIQIDISRQEKNLTIKVKDNGEGIASKNLPQLFNSTFTFGKQGGTGLGLSYCKNVIEAHEGRISATSKQNKGATFAVEIPNCILSMPVTGTKTGKKKTGDSEKINSNKRILVMDDEEDLLVTWRILLKKATGNSPMEISSPEKLIEMNLDSSLIDMAIIDYEFKGSSLTGIDVIEYLKRKGINDVYLCTAYHQDKDIQARSAKIGIKQIIPKPIPENILSKIL